MSPIIMFLLYGLSMTFIGSVGAWWLCWRYLQQAAHGEVKARSRYTANILSHLQELAGRVALDVDEHSNRVEAINNTLGTAECNMPDVIVDVVAKLIHANQEMKVKLASTETKLRRQAQEMEVHATEARTDSLTLLANRRAFDDTLARRVAEFHRLGQPFSLLMADVDFFKKFNDTHGHQAGDEVLQSVAKLLRRMMRDMDLVARYGGEEFAVILPAANLENACKVARRACESIQKFHFSYEMNDKLHITLSLGVAEILPKEDGTTLVMRADKALYAAKQGGRNCVYMHDGQNVKQAAKNEQSPPAKAKQRQQSPVPAGGAETVQNAGSALDAAIASPDADAACGLDLDEFSKLCNRTNFCQQVRSRTAEWKRAGSTFSIVMMEVKQHDQLAEKAGASQESAARTAASYFDATVRDMDTLGFYAPGCFALLLPAAGLANAIQIAERLREGFSQYSMAAQDSQNGLSLSIGVVEVMDADNSISLLKRAEAALDAADRRGGNCIYYHDGKRCAPISAMLETMDYLS